MHRKIDRKPWRCWAPGVLSRSQVKTLHRLGLITIERPGRLDIGACSIDLSLSNKVFELRDGSIKPSPSASYDSILKKPKYAKSLRPSGDGSFLLKQGHTYVFRLRERLSRDIAQAEIYGQATAKSSIGRVDLLARLIVDRMDRYESFDPDRLKGSSGKMYLEITPFSFSVTVRPGLCMTQLRLFYGNPKDSEISSRELCKSVLGPSAVDHVLRLDLSPQAIGGFEVSAFRTKSRESSLPPIPLGEKNSVPPGQYWRLVVLKGRKRLKIRRDEFYILRSKERLFVPNGIAIYCRATDETIGEMRIHYAGFVHPGFGMRRKDHLRGTPLIFEVRGHELNANLRDGEEMANLVFYRMSSHDKKSLEINQAYNDQNLKLSNIFKKWPKKPKKIGRAESVDKA
jgi:dCTP deaminase